MQAATIAIALFLVLIVTAAYFSIQLQVRRSRQRSHAQTQEKQTALLLHPSYQAKIEQDRAYQLATRKLDLFEQKQIIELDILQKEAALKQYLALHRILAETYSINEDVSSLTAFPSLKPVPPDKLTPAAEPPPLTLPIPTFRDLLKQGVISESQPLIIGVRPTGDLRTGSWLDLYTLAVAGVAGTGKSTSVLFYLLQAVLHGAKLVMIDPHAETKPDSLARRLAGLPPTCYVGKFAIANQEILSRVRMVATKLKRRQRSGLPAGQAGKSYPLILVVDEFTRLMRTRDIAEELGELLEAIAQEGRGYNIFALLTGQVWVATRTGGTELRYSIASSLIHRIQEAQAELLIPRKYAKYCPELKTGQALLYDTNGQSEILSMPLTTSADVTEVAALLMGGSAGGSWTGSAGGSVVVQRDVRLNNGKQGTNQDEPVTEPLEIPPLSQEDVHLLDCMSRGMSHTQIIAELYGITTKGAAYQQKLGEVRAAMQRIAQHTKARIGA